jgi:hypothetical protein
VDGKRAQGPRCGSGGEADDVHLFTPSLDHAAHVVCGSAHDVHLSAHVVFCAARDGFLVERVVRGSTHDVFLEVHDRFPSVE